MSPDRRTSKLDGEPDLFNVSFSHLLHNKAYDLTCNSVADDYTNYCAANPYLIIRGLRSISKSTISNYCHSTVPEPIDEFTGICTVAVKPGPRAWLEISPETWQAVCISVKVGFIYANLEHAARMLQDGSLGIMATHAIDELVSTHRQMLRKSLEKLGVNFESQSVQDAIHRLSRSMS